MKKIKKILIILIICLAIISIAIVLYNIFGPKIDKPHEIEEEYNPVLSDKSIELLNVRNRYFVVKGIVERYYRLLCDLNSETVKQENVEQTNNMLYSFFDKSFLDSTNITKDNIQEKLDNYKNLYVDINNIKYIESIDLAVYFVDGQIIEKDTKEKNDFILMLVIDSQNSTFNIYTEDYIKEKQLDKFSKESFDLLGYSDIENRQYNKYSYELILDETYCNSLLDSLINRLKYNTDYSYDLLKDEYKKKKFSNIENYREYVNKLSLEGIFLDQYKIIKDENRKEYICIDNKGKTWIFYENTIMNYQTVLDTYTIDIPEFVEKYEESNSQVKTALNIQKIVDALNDGDYKYAYGKLAEEFKQNNFQTLDSFEQYAINTFGRNIKVEYNSFIETSNYCTYDIILKNGGNDAKKTIIMKLQDGTDFVFSFNVD